VRLGPEREKVASSIQPAIVGALPGPANYSEKHGKICGKSGIAARIDPPGAPSKRHVPGFGEPRTPVLRTVLRASVGVWTLVQQVPLRQSAAVAQTPPTLLVPRQMPPTQFVDWQSA
jgi:hypothetical protein